MSVHEAAVSDDHLRALKALRDRLASEIDVCESKRDMAALSQRLMDVLEQIASLGPAQPAAGSEETGLSEFERRLRDRDPAATARRAGRGA